MTALMTPFWATAEFTLDPALSREEASELCSKLLVAFMHDDRSTAPLVSYAGTGVFSVSAVVGADGGSEAIEAAAEVFSSVIFDAAKATPELAVTVEPLDAPLEGPQRN